MDAKTKISHNAKMMMDDNNDQITAKYAVSVPPITVISFVVDLSVDGSEEYHSQFSTSQCNVMFYLKKF